MIGYTMIYSDLNERFNVLRKGGGHSIKGMKYSDWNARFF